ncbi:MAG: sigma-70 family RNA polymerase sigma factor [Acidobacteriia bacterium]|nr:sigma-70 family RNA polymerase sigma factor [Terriglobia bacterium]MBV8905948.1 sigma-70 family RNA polymerase sigma factor [Terriglobia bacterium]MBV9743108.1 sigma-70 family RNA polymerase sigma factor [Terriglobia bacterium]
METSTELSELIAAWGGGEEAALHRLMPLLYPELRRIARCHLRRRPNGHTLESAALANEVYLKLIRAGGIPCENRSHFLALCSQMVRRVLVDHARLRGFAKRGGSAVRTTLNDGLLGTPHRTVELLALDEALEGLSKLDPRKGRLVEMRYFGGLTLEEAAGALGISVETAKRDWRMAKAWLFGALRS